MLAEIRPQSYHDYLALPILGPLLDEFTIWSRTRGYTLGTVKNQLKDTRHIVRFFESDGLHDLKKLTQADFEKAWQFFRLDKPSVAGTIRQLECFIDSVHGLPALSPSPKTRSDLELHQFSDYLKRVRGLVDSTIQSHLNYLHRFLELIAFDSNQKALANLRLTQIEEFLHCLSQSLNRDSLQHVMGYLRSFLRFEYSRGAIEEPLHEMIDSPRLYRLEKLPCSLSWKVVDELLGLIDRTTPQGVRNYAMLLLTAAYGLRSCEVVSLKLDDIDWHKAEVRIAQTKNDNQLILPLTDTIANALIDYLKNARPDLPYREVFLRVRAPHGTLKSTAVTEAFQREVRLSGLDIPYQGPHCLRHSFAVHLLREGTSVKEIGDVLGHHSTESSCVYLRLAIDDLRCVTLEVPECLDANVEINHNILKDLPPVRTLRSSTPAGPPRSFLNERINGYLKLHRSLGKKFSREEAVLLSFDSFLASHCPKVSEINGAIFNEWSETLAAYTPTDRRNRMRIIRNLCLYLKRSCRIVLFLTF